MIREFIKQNGWNDETTKCGAFRVMSVTVNFNNNGNEDEVEFDINCYDEEELETLFFDFCKENRFDLKNIAINLITIVNKAETMNKLIYGDEEENVNIRICPNCRKKVDKADMVETRDCFGITMRFVCDSCYQKVMAKGYDGVHYSSNDENVDVDY